jgi:hypothetical protein
MESLRSLIFPTAVSTAREDELERVAFKLARCSNSERFLAKRIMPIEPVKWTEKFSVGVRQLDQQHQQLIKLLIVLISTQGTTNTHSEPVSDTLMAMTRYAQAPFKWIKST